MRQINVIIILIIFITFTLVSYFFLWNLKFDFILDKKIYGLKVWNTLSDHRQLINDYNENFLPDTQFVKSNLNEINLHLESWKSSNYNKQFFIELYENDLFIIQSAGNIFKVSNIDSYTLDKKFEKVLIKSNIFKYLNTNFVHILDSLLVDNTIYISIKFKENENCNKYKILQSNILNEELLFSEFITLDGCSKVKESSLLGGRMINYVHKGKSGLLLTTSNTILDHPTSQPQDNNSIFGKILFIDYKTKQYYNFSKGHRNPQGLLVIDDVILSTEHGPKGGDEINKIIFNKNYGWPVASYGDMYKYPILSPKYLKNHKQNDFVEPIFSYVPSIGISEIVKIPKSISDFWINNFFIASLHGNSLYRVQFDEDYNKILFNEKIFIGSRIRDLKFSLNKKKIFLALEYKNGVLGIIDFEN